MKTNKILLNDVLDLSKVEADKLHITSNPMHLRRECNEVTDMLRILAIKKGLSLVLRMGASLPEWIIADSLRFRQCLYNVINNGLKFTEQGWVIVDNGAL